MHVAVCVGTVFGSLVAVVRVVFVGPERDGPVSCRRPQRTAMGRMPDIREKPD
jgi:hypothetical protein